MIDFHGRGKKPRYFEGWYFKQHINGRVLALIPGVSIDKAKGEDRLLQVIDDIESHFSALPYEEFHWEKEPSS